MASTVRLLGLKSIIPTNFAINYPQDIGTADTAEGGMLLLSQETCLDPSCPSGRHTLLAAKSSWRFPPTCSPASPVVSGLVGETSSSVEYLRLDFAKDMLSLFFLFLELARLSSVWPGLQSFPWNNYMVISPHPLGGDFFGAVSLRTQFTVPKFLCSNLRLADLSYSAQVLAARGKNLFFLCSSPGH